MITVSEALENSAELGNAGGLAYLAALAQNTPSASNIKRYAEIVRDRGVMRKLAEVGTTIADSAYNPLGRNAGQLLDEAEAKVFEIAEANARGKQGFVEIQPLLTQVVERIDELFQRDNPDEVTGIPDRLSRSGSKNLRPAAGRSDHRGRPAEYGQDRVFHQHRRKRRAATPACRSRSSVWKWAAPSWRCV